ncbi:MAG: M24 family metallopeptidase [Dongiaceae bacterium]
MAKAVVEGVDAGLATARPGATAEQVEAAWQAVLRKNGLKKESRVGYSVGLAYPPDWGERTVSLRPGDKTELQLRASPHPGRVWPQEWGAATGIVRGHRQRRRSLLQCCARADRSRLASLGMEASFYRR